jgi:hypothetical protein
MLNNTDASKEFSLEVNTEKKLAVEPRFRMFWRKYVL